MDKGKEGQMDEWINGRTHSLIYSLTHTRLYKNEVAYLNPPLTIETYQTNPINPILQNQTKLDYTKTNQMHHPINHTYISSAIFGYPTPNVPLLGGKSQILSRNQSEICAHGRESQILGCILLFRQCLLCLPPRKYVWAKLCKLGGS